jgi:putative NIF3 family GTP cyclohydrolase 1 type 2
MEGMLYRTLTIVSLSAAAALGAQTSNAPTARAVIESIKQHSAVPWDGPTVDTFKAGDPDTPVTGIATTMMATFDVLKRAAAQHANLIITHEPTFYSHEDKTDWFAAANDRVWQQKEDFIKENHLVVWRFHDHWHTRHPDGILSGMTEALGWQGYARADMPDLFVMPVVSLRALAKSVEERIGIKVLRVVGNPDVAVTKVALMPGAAGTQRQIQMLRRDDVEVLVIGEVPEWETIEYVADASAEGRHKALILMGHIPSEQAGMRTCAEWLRKFITDVPVTFVETKEFFWQP